MLAAVFRMPDVNITKRIFILGKTYQKHTEPDYTTLLKTARRIYLYSHCCCFVTCVLSLIIANIFID